MLDSQHLKIGDSGKPARLACRCLKVTEAEVVRAIAALNLRTLKEVRLQTGAGGGCTCCHQHLLKYLTHPAAAVSN
jgi:bacterioferritin-associated ferredoxin